MKKTIEELKQKYKKEKVFVLPIDLVTNIPDKFTLVKKDNSIFSKYDNLGTFIYRYDAEYNNAFQQIIPYFFITNKDESKYFVAKRIQGDSRLIDKLSLGFGGHINDCDGNNNIVYHALNREMHEELNIPNNLTFKYLGTMRDITSETSEHFGLIFSVKVDDEKLVSIKETENLEGVWMTPEELFKDFNKFENWSKYILDYILKDVNL